MAVSRRIWPDSFSSMQVWPRRIGLATAHAPLKAAAQAAALDVGEAGALPVRENGQRPGVVTAELELTADTGVGGHVLVHHVVRHERERRVGVARGERGRQRGGDPDHLGARALDAVLEVGRVVDVMAFWTRALRPSQ